MCADDESITESRSDHDGGELRIDPLAVQQEQFEFEVEFVESGLGTRAGRQRFRDHHELLSGIMPGYALTLLTSF